MSKSSSAPLPPAQPTMLEWAEKLAQARAAMEERECLEENLQESISRARQLDKEVDRLAAAAGKEQEDVARLEGFGLYSIFQSLAGDKEAKLDKERGEAREAAQRHVAARSELDLVRERVFTMRRLIEELGDVEAYYDSVLEERKAWLLSLPNAAGTKLYAMAKEQVRLANRLQGLDEAVQAAYEAKNLMDRMLGYLREARGWGWADLVGPQAGGGPLMDRWSKYDAFGAALVDAVETRQALARLQAATGRGDMPCFEIHYPESMLKLADAFADGLAIDALLQSRVLASLDSVQAAAAQVDEILKELRPVQLQTRTALEETSAELRKLLESEA